MKITGLLLSAAIAITACSSSKAVTVVKNEKSPELATRTVKLPKFTGIKVDQIISVKYSQGALVPAEIKANPEIIEKVRLSVNNNGLLTISIDSNNESRKNQNYNVTVYLTAPMVNYFSVGGVSSLNVRTDLNLKEQPLTVNASGVSNIRFLDVNAGDTKITLSGTSSMKATSMNLNDAKINLSGLSSFSTPELSANSLLKIVAGGVSSATIPDLNAKTFTANVSGTSKIKVSKYNGEQATFNVSGVSSASFQNINAQDLTTNISGCSKITLSGFSKSASITSTGMGSIYAKELQVSELRSMNIDKGASIKIDTSSLRNIISNAVNKSIKIGSFKMEND